MEVKNMGLTMPTLALELIMKNLVMAIIKSMMERKGMVIIRALTIQDLLQQHQEPSV